MSKLSDKKKKEQLGMAQGTARNKLVKMLLFQMAKELDKDVCHQCSEKIESIDNFSIEHKTPWLDSKNPVELYFDLDNIAFSHHSCNIKAGRREEAKCGTFQKYRNGCKCDECKKANRDMVYKYRST